MIDEEVQKEVAKVSESLRLMVIKHIDCYTFDHKAKMDTILTVSEALLSCFVLTLTCNLQNVELEKILDETMTLIRNNIKNTFKKNREKMN